jgi:hypothetical protein
LDQAACAWPKKGIRQEKATITATRQEYAVVLFFVLIRSLFGF